MLTNSADFPESRMCSHKEFLTAARAHLSMFTKTPGNFMKNGQLQWLFETLQYGYKRKLEYLL